MADNNLPPAFSLNEKRFYVPGVTVRSSCPICGTEHTRNLGEDYLSYPKANEPTYQTFYCSSEIERDGEWEEIGCEHEWTVQLIVRVEVQAVNGCSVEYPASAA